MVCWDYHCFAILRDDDITPASVRIFDLDRRALRSVLQPCMAEAHHASVNAWERAWGVLGAAAYVVPYVRFATCCVLVV